MSMPPYCFTVPSTSASTSFLREMLHGMTVASPPLFLIDAATSSQASALRLEITTLAPSIAQCSAIERPMPRLDPVTIATLFARLNGEAGCGAIGVFSLALKDHARRTFADKPRVFAARKECPPDTSSGNIEPNKDAEGETTCVDGWPEALRRCCWRCR